MDNAEEPKYTPEPQSKGVWEKFRAKLRKGEHSSLAGKKNEPPRITTVPQQAIVEAQRVKEIKDSLVEETTPKPTWADKEVALSSINLRELPINWQALSNLGKAINEIKDDRFERKDLIDIKPPAETYSALSMVASVVANKRNPKIPIILPTQVEIKTMKPWLTKVERFIGRFSENWARKFDGYIEKKGAQVVSDVGTRIINLTEVFRDVENPREQFLREVTLMYQNLQRKETEEGFWGEENEVIVEDKIYNLLHALIEFKINHEWPDNTPRWLNNHDFPLMLRLLPKLNMPPDSLDEGKASIAGAEMMKGFEVFLRQQGVKKIGSAPAPREVDLFNPSSWMRGLAETFAHEKLERVKNGLPNMLTQAYHVLPSDGPELAEKIYDVAENICVLKAQGRTAEEIASHIFERVSKYLLQNHSHYR